MKNLHEALNGCLPTDHSRQVSSKDVCVALLRGGFNASSILDLGCGDGRTIDFFEKVAPLAKWTGLDIEESPEVNLRTRSDGTFVTYDGVNVPFGDETFDLVFSHQVLEHVRFPEAVLAEAFRVCKRGGYFLCSTSQLEPYHSFSYWNFTAFGLQQILTDAGFEVAEMRPGIDGITLIRRSMSPNRADFNHFFSSESPGNEEIERSDLPVREKNLRKLMYCGHVVALCRKV